MRMPPTPLSKETLVRQQIGHFEFTAVDPDNVSSRHVTLAAVAIDRSCSAHDFLPHMVRMLQRLVTTCAQSDVADSVLMRLSGFGNKPEEIHGFYPMARIAAEDYDDVLSAGGTTALYDAVYDAVSSTTHFATMLSRRGVKANGVVVVVADGFDNSSIYTAKEARTVLAEANDSDVLESLVSIFVGINPVEIQYTREEMRKLLCNLGTEYMDLPDTSAETFLGLADRLSDVVLAQRRRLGV